MCLVSGVSSFLLVCVIGWAGGLVFALFFLFVTFAPRVFPFFFLLFCLFLAYTWARPHAPARGVGPFESNFPLNARRHNSDLLVSRLLW